VVLLWAVRGARCSRKSYWTTLSELNHTLLSIHQTTPNMLQSRKALSTTVPEPLTLTGPFSLQMTEPFWEEDGRASRAAGSWSLSESWVKVWGNIQGQEP